MNSSPAEAGSCNNRVNQTEASNEGSSNNESYNAEPNKAGPSKVKRNNKTSSTPETNTYKDLYLKYGFTYIGPKDHQLPVCIECDEILDNDSMTPLKLRKHFNTKHGSLTNQLLNNHFRLLLKSKEKSTETTTTTTRKDKVISYKVAEMIVKRLQPHTIVETSIIPACTEIVKSLPGNDDVSAIANLDLSNKCISNCIKKMSSDIKKQLVKQLSDKKFSLLLDIHHGRQLLSYVRFFDTNTIVEHFLSYTEFPVPKSPEDIYVSMETILRNNELHRENCVSVFVAGASDNENQSFASHLKSKNFSESIHYFFPQRVLITRTIPEELNDVMSAVDKMVQSIMFDQLGYDVRQILCQKLGSPYKVLLYCNKYWMFRSNALSTFYEQRERLSEIFVQKHPDFYNLLRNAEWCSKLAYFVDITENVIDLTIDEEEQYTIFNFQDKMKIFRNRIESWKSQIITSNDFSMFQRTHKTDAKKNISKMIIKHLSTIQDKLQKYVYYDNMDKYIWVLNPFAVLLKEIHLPNDAKEEMLKLQADRNLERKRQNLQPFQFWCSAAGRYPVLRETALSVFLRFSSSNLLELGRSALRAIIFYNEEQIISVEDELRLYLSKTQAHIE